MIAVKKPAGFYYFSDFISQQEETFLIEQLSKFRWEEVKMHGVIAKRRVKHFGLNYTYSSRTTTPGASPPAFLKPFIERVSLQLDVDSDEIAEILITEYPVGAGIGWHKDAAIFGDVFGISLLSDCILKLRLKNDKHNELVKLILAPRSGYILTGAARNLWQHCIPPVNQARYSITFRTLKKKK